MPPPDREPVRRLSDGEWAVLDPWIQRYRQAQEAARQAQAREALAKAHVDAMVAALNGGADPTVRLDVEKRELYRVDANSIPAK